MIDMHIHTKYSDGTYTVKEVLEKAEKLGLEYISITDHDNCRAYNELENLNVKEYFSGKLVRGIELKCLYNARLIEILGYNYDKEKLESWLNDFYKNRQRKDTQTRYFNILYFISYFFNCIYKLNNEYSLWYVFKFYKSNRYIFHIMAI